MTMTAIFSQGKRLVQKVLGFNPSVFTVKMGGPENTDQIMSALGFPFNDLITQVNFPLKKSESPYKDEIEIVDPGCSFSEEEGLQILQKKGLLRPTYEHGICFAKQHGKATTSEKKPFVIFLHEAWLDQYLDCRFVCRFVSLDLDRRFVCLDRSDEYRKLNLYCPGRRFDDNCVLAGVRPREQSQS